MMIQIVGTIIIAAILVCAAYHLGYESGLIRGRRDGKREGLAAAQDAITKAKRSWPERSRV